MLPTDKKHACQSVPLDVLCSLPENVIDDILICLPLEDVVRTSILSTKWRYKWCRISQLKLDNKTLWGTTRDTKALTIKLTDIIHHLLAYHVGPISKFVLAIDVAACPEIDKLIYFLSRNGIQHLDLAFSLFKQCKLPSSIFTCLQLRHLFLQNCSILLVPLAFKGFDSLTSLELRYIKTSSKILQRLISNCPLLEQLRLYHNCYSDAIEINAPMLRTFDFFEKTGFICFRSVPLLEKLTLWHVEYHVETGNCFESFLALEHLVLNERSLKFLAAGASELPTSLPFGLNSLKSLRLVDIYLGELDVVSCVLCLIRSVQYLQYLDIQVCDKGDDIPAMQCLELEAFSDETFSHLREVKLRSTIGSDPEMQLIKLLLAKSPMLEKMLIEPSLRNGHAGKTIKIPAVLNSFRRASPEVEVVYDYYG